MPEITKTINHQNSTPLFKETLQVRQKKQESSKWFSTKTKIAAAGILSTIGLIYLPQHLKKIPAPITPSTNPMPGIILTVIGLASYYFIYSYINSEITKRNNITEKMSNATAMKFVKLTLICNELDRIEKQSTQSNFNISDYQKSFDSHEKTLLRFDDRHPSDIQLHGTTLKIYFSFILDFQPESAKNIAETCREHLKNNSFPGFNSCFTDIIEMMDARTNPSKANNDLDEPKANNHNINVSRETVLENNALDEDTSLKIFTDIVIEFNQVTKEFGYHLEFTKEGYEKIFPLTKQLHSLGNLNELFEKLNENVTRNFKPFISLLTGIIEKILYKPNLLEQLYHDNTYIKKFETAFEALLNISKDSALKIATAYLVIKPEENDEQTSLYQNSIMDSLMQNKDIAIEFAMICAGYPEKFQKIANDIWEKIKNSNEEKEKYLIGCAKINNPFCQNKLKDYVFLQDSFGISLVQACTDHLFTESSAFPLDGNAALVFKALRDFRHKDEQTKKDLLPIAQQTVESFSKAKGIKIGDLHWKLGNDISENLKESESKVSIFDAPRIINILFDIYFYTKDYKKMNSLLNDCFAVNGFNFYSESLDFLETSSDEKWKAIANCTFKDDSPVDQNQLTY